MSYHDDRPLPPVTALDDLYDVPRVFTPENGRIPLYDERPRRPRRCWACGSIRGHTTVNCPGWED